jgi:hypothetical protein
VRYRVTYQAPADGPPLRKDQHLSVVRPVAMMTVKPVNDQYELDDVPYGLYDWQRL